MRNDTGAVAFRCYTSEDANWSLNAAMINRHAALTRALRLKPGQTPTLVDIAAASHFKQDAFESAMLDLDWGRSRVPLCLSFQGVFIHREVDG